MNRKKILVTGGTGFIGRHLVKYLKETGHDVLVFTRDGKLVQKDSEFFMGDICDPGAVVEAVGFCDAVIHLAGVLGTTESLANPELLVEVNILGSINVFEACKIHKKRCLNVSVGNYWMNNPYAITKATAERFASMFNKEHNTEIMNVRVFNAYGPGQKAYPVRKLVPNAILSALRGEDVTIYGTGEQVIDLIYVEDVAKVLVNTLNVPQPNLATIGEIGCGRGLRVNEVVESIIRFADSNSKIIRKPMRQGETPQSATIADVGTLMNLGVQLQQSTSLDEGLKKTVEWYSRHLAEFKNQ